MLSHGEIVVKKNAQRNVLASRRSLSKMPVIMLQRAVAFVFRLATGLRNTIELVRFAVNVDFASSV